MLSLGLSLCPWHTDSLDRAVTGYGVRLLASPGSTPCRFTPDFCKWESCWAMGFLGDPPFPPPLHSGAAPYLPRFTIVGSLYLDVKRRPNLSTSTPTLSTVLLLNHFRKQRTTDHDAELSHPHATILWLYDFYEPRGHLGREVSLLASHQGKPGSIPGFSHVGFVPDDATGRRVFSEISRFLPPFHSSAALYSPQSPSSALKTSLLKAARISSLHEREGPWRVVRSQRDRPTLSLVHGRTTWPSCCSPTQSGPEIKQAATTKEWLGGRPCQFSANSLGGGGDLAGELHGGQHAEVFGSRGVLLSSCCIIHGGSSRWPAANYLLSPPPPHRSLIDPLIPSPRHSKILTLGCTCDPSGMFHLQDSVLGPPTHGFHWSVISVTPAIVPILLKALVVASERHPWRGHSGSASPLEPTTAATLFDRLLKRTSCEALQSPNRPPIPSTPTDSRGGCPCKDQGACITSHPQPEDVLNSPNYRAKVDTQPQCRPVPTFIIPEIFFALKFRF
ncbi:hypothetical protein PR048_024753 [Dryococelus australis]|uniref:Uncharacterized protein n=1 Tax=Dryococelus australis TaxID=614101 RepID=A0ABQ9GPF2_9NEOP|nr:hypothetical protein PR048_024753 [Dryococelus australis]